jgi:hypothetical protein
VETVNRVRWADLAVYEGTIYTSEGRMMSAKSHEFIAWIINLE